MGYESIAHEAGGRRPKAEWAIYWEAIRVRGIISRLNIFRKLKLDINPFLQPKHYKYGGRFSLLVGYNV